MSLRTQPLSQVKRADGLSEDSARPSTEPRPPDLFGTRMISTPESLRGRRRDRRDGRRGIVVARALWNAHGLAFYTFPRLLQGREWIRNPATAAEGRGRRRRRGRSDHRRPRPRRRPGLLTHQIRED